MSLSHLERESGQLKAAVNNHGLFVHWILIFNSNAESQFRFEKVLFVKMSTQADIKSQLKSIED